MTSARVSRTVIKSIMSIEKAEGIGARVRRSIGTPELPNFTPFLMLDNFQVPEGAGFGNHPHRGMTTLTYMLEGTMEHEDIKKNRGKLGPGDLQFMIAGRGIMHAEMPHHVKGEPIPHGLQLWIDLPSKYKLVEPSYQELKASAIPSAHPSPHTTIKVVCGTAEGKEGFVSSPVRSLGGCWFLDYQVAKEGEEIYQAIPVGWNCFIYTLSGSLTSSNSSLLPFTTTVFTSTPDQTGISLVSTSPSSRFFIIAGEPLDQAITQYGPFVMETEEEIQQAFKDYQQGTGGFEGAKEWESEIAKGM